MQQLEHPESPPSVAVVSDGAGLHDTPVRQGVPVPRSGSLALHLYLFILLYCCYVYVHQDYSGGTSVSRLDLLQSIMTHGTFAIDHYQENTSDKARYAGHYYSDKAPGTAAAALPAFGLGDILDRLLNPAERDRADTPGYGGSWLVRSWVGTAGSVGVLTALGGVFFFAWVRRWVEPGCALMATLALFLGSMPFTYATMMFSHGMVAGLLAIALWSASRGRGQNAQAAARLCEFPNHNSARRLRISAWTGVNRWDLLTGFCCGCALASEYTAGPIVVAVVLWVLARDWRRLGGLSIGAILPLLLIPAYSVVCFGTPWAVGYSYHSTFQQMHQGVFGIQWPNATVAGKYLVSPERGLLFWSPWFLLSAPGWVELWRRDRKLFWLTLLGPLVLTIVMSGYSWDWRAGWTWAPAIFVRCSPC